MIPWLLIGIGGRKLLRRFELRNQQQTNTYPLSIRLESRCSFHRASKGSVSENSLPLAGVRRVRSSFVIRPGCAV
jgi:hypothetical protein